MNTFVCEYDSTTLPCDDAYITSLVKEFAPNHKQISEKHYIGVWDEFVSRGHDYIQLNMNQINNNCLAFKLNDITYFSYVIHTGLNGEQWYYGKII